MEFILIIVLLFRPAIICFVFPNTKSLITKKFSRECFPLIIAYVVVVLPFAKLAYEEELHNEKQTEVFENMEPKVVTDMELQFFKNKENVILYFGDREDSVRLEVDGTSLRTYQGDMVKFVKDENGFDVYRFKNEAAENRKESFSRKLE